MSRACSVGVVGATGQVGVVMRQILPSASFPVDEIRFFASARSAGTRAAVRRPRDHRRGRRDRRPDRPRHRAVLRRRHHLARAGAAVRRGRRDRHRQLLGLADGPRRPAGRQRGQPRRRSPRRRKGIIANPNCTTMAAMPVLKPLHDEAGLVRLIASHLPGGVRLAASPASRSSPARSSAVGDKARELAYDGVGGRRSREPVKYVAHDRLQRAAAGRLDRRRRPRRDRRGAEAPQRVAARSSASPTCWSPAPACGCRSSPATRCRSTPSSPRPLTVAAGPRAARRRARASSSPTSRRRCRRPARTRPTSAGIRQDPGVADDRGLALFVSNDNLRKGAALNTVQIAELLAAR